MGEEGLLRGVHTCASININFLVLSNAHVHTSVAMDTKLSVNSNRVQNLIIVH